MKPHPPSDDIDLHLLEALDRNVTEIGSILQKLKRRQVAQQRASARDQDAGDESEPDDGDQPMSIREICEYLGLSEATLWRLRKRGEFPDLIQVSPGRFISTRGQVKAFRESRRRSILSRSGGADLEHSDA